MSKYYIIATNKELKLKSQTFSYKKLNVDYLRNINEGYLDEKFHYMVNFSNFTDIGYNITNYHYFDTDMDKLFFAKFLKEIEDLLNCGYEISLYQFWENSRELVLDENLIYQSKEISTNPDDYREDYFRFEFNTKYIFVKKENY